MDGVYLPDGRQLALIDRDWILDELPHLGNPDDNSDANYLLASAAAAANCCGSIGTSSSAGRTTSTIGTANSSAHGTSPHPIGGTGRAVDGTGASGTTAVNHQGTGTVNNHSLLSSPDEFESDLTLLSEIVDETQNKWSDFGLNQLLTSYERPTRPILK